MDQEPKNKDFFEDGNIEEDLSKLEAEIEETGSDDEEAADKKNEAVELDLASLSLQEEKEGVVEGTEAVSPGPEVNPPPAPAPVPATPWYFKKNIVGISIVALIIVVSVVIYILMGKPMVSDKKEGEQQKAPADYGSVRGKIVPEAPLPAPSFALSPFIIPIEKGRDNAYLFLSISVMSPNRKVYEEIKKKSAFLRGDLYDLLKKIVNGGKVKIAPRKEIKREILKSLNKRLDSGKIKEVYFTDFLLV